MAKRDYERVHNVRGWVAKMKWKWKGNWPGDVIVKRDDRWRGSRIEREIMEKNGANKEKVERSVTLPD